MINSIVFSFFLRTSSVWKILRLLTITCKWWLFMKRCVKTRNISSSSKTIKKNETEETKSVQTKDRVASWSIVVVSGVANVAVSCLLCRQQEHAGLNPTESMTRALISDDNIARQSALGPVQLGYVLPLLITPFILSR